MQEKEQQPKFYGHSIKNEADKTNWRWINIHEQA